MALTTTYLRLGFVVVFMLLLTPRPGAAQQSESQAQIENIANAAALGAQMAASIASIPGGILAPYPASLGFEIAGYGADIGLVHTGPVFQAPRDLTVAPNAVPGRGTLCKYRFSSNVSVDQSGSVPALKSDYSSVFYINYKPLADNFADLGVPRQLYHANADVVVSASNPNLDDNVLSLPGFGTTIDLVQPEFPSGVHRIDWEARTQMNLVFDIAIPSALLAFAGYSEYRTAQKVASGAIKASVKNDFIKQGAFAVAKELGLVVGNIALQDLLAATTVPTTPNFDTQFLTVYDTTGPYFSLPGSPGSSVNIQRLQAPLEASDFGGVRLARVQQQLRSRFNTVDDCGEELDLTLETDINTLLPTGVTSAVSWDLREVANGPFEPGYQPERGQRFENGILINKLTQSLTVEDTQAPLLVPPAGFAAERNSPLPVSSILSREFPVGQPLVTDLADATPVTDFTIAGAPTQLELDQRYVLSWFSVDDSGNSTAAGPLAQDQFEQLVTLKSPNTNVAPTAFAASGSGITSRPIEITLSGNDPDVLPVVGRGESVADPLAFVIKDYPDNGEFEAPLYPYFIHDYRLTPNGEAEEGDNLSRVSPLGPLAAEFSLQANQSLRSAFLTDNVCTTSDADLLTRFSRVIPLDFVYAPLLVQVLDDGNVYMLDTFFYCGTLDGGSASQAIAAPRLSLWSQAGELLAMQAIKAQRSPGSGSAVRQAQWVLDEPQANFQFVGRKLVFDAKGDLLITLFWINGPEICTRTYSVAPELNEASARGKQCGDLGDFAFPQGPIADSLNGVNIMVSQADAADGPDAPDVIRVYDARFNNFYGEEGLLGIMRVPDADMTAYSVATDSLGSVYVLDRPNDRVHKFSPTTQLPNGDWKLGEHVGWMGKCDVNRRNAAGVPFSACDEERRISLGYSCTEEKCGIEFEVGTDDTGGPLEGQFRNPQQIAVDPNDILYVADFGNSRIQRFGPDGTFAGSADSEGDGFVIGNFGEPRNVSVNSGSMFVLESFSPFFDVFLHSFQTVPFFDVTANSAKVKYISHFDHQGPDSFTYAVSDGIAESAPVDVDLFLTRAFRSPRNLTVTCYAQQPPAPFTDCTTPEDGEGLYVELSASDPDGFLSTGGLDSLTFMIDHPPAHGTLEEIDQGTDSAQVYLYTPAADYHGSDQFEFSVTDGNNSAASSAPTTLFVTPTPDPVMIEFDDNLIAPRGFPFSLIAQYSDIDANEVVQQLLTLDWGDGVAATLENGFADSGRVDLNGEEVDPQLHFGQGRGAVLGTHTYVSPGLRTIAIEMSNAAENIDQPTRQTARISVQDAVFTAAQITAPMAPVNPEQPFALNIEVANLIPMGGNGLAANNTVASYELPPGVTLVSGDPRCTGTVEISCALGTLASGESTVISTEVQISLASAREENLYELSIKLTDAGPKIGDMSMGFGSLEVADSDFDSVIDVDDVFDDDPRYSFDSDGDGLPDAWELAFGYDPEVADNVASDEDGDGISLLDEFARGSFPQLADGSRLIEDVTLRAPTPESNDTFGVAIVHADFDQDGFSDFVVGGSNSGTTGRAMVYYGRADAEPVPQELLPPDPAARDFGESMAVGDFDGNGRADLLVNSTTGAYVYYNDGALPLRPSATISVTTGGEARTAFAVGDLDNDGIDDLASSYRRPGTSNRGIQLFLSANDPEVLSGEQSNPLDAAPEIIEDTRPYADRDALIVDIDGDGLNDLVLAASQTGVSAVHIYFGDRVDWNNPGNFVPTRVLNRPGTQGGFGWSIAAGFDLGSDGITDLVVGSIGASGVDEMGWINIYNSEDVYWEGPHANRVPSQIIAGRAGRVGPNDARGDAFGADVVLAKIEDEDKVSLIVGASRAGAEDTGEVLIYRSLGDFVGGEAFNRTPVQILEGRPPTAAAENDRNSVFGRPIAVVGDVDGDGVNDLAVAAPGFGVGATPKSGFVRLFLHGYSALTPGQDADGDGVRDAVDNCPDVANTNRANADNDAFGNACDDDDDNDQLSDAYELTHGLDPLRFDANEDFDGDGLTNLDEFMRMLSPSDPDTDRDGIDDGAEIAAGTDPLFADTDADGIINTVDLDDDADGVADTMELALGLDPLNALDALADLDGDGFSNLAELQADSGVNDMGSMPETGEISRLFASVLPGHRSTQTGNAVTAFATIINTTDETAEGCSIVPLRPLEARWSYTPTDAATNIPNAPGNTPVAIESGAAQSYVFEVDPEAVMSDELELRFDCFNTAPVNTIMGLNSFGLTVADQPLVDMVALTATLSGDGILRIDGASGSGAFAVATVNVGAAGTVTARVRAANGLPVVAGICETDTATGLCLNNQIPRADWLVDVAANATPTFSVFATATGNIPLDPANNRIVVEFLNAAGDRVGASSVAVSTR